MAKSGTDAYTTTQVAAMTGLSRTTVIRWTREGVIPHKRKPPTRPGGYNSYIYPKALFDAWWSADDSLKPLPGQASSPPVSSRRSPKGRRPTG